MKITVQNEDLHLLSKKAFFWPREKILGFSDVHLGKAESFQQWGVPLPSGEHQQDLANISSLIHETEATRVFILGDLVHHKSSWTENIHRDLTDFFQKHSSTEFNLLLGNHERGSIPELKNYPLELMPEDHQIGKIRMSHGHEAGHFKPDQKESSFQICGHIHPVVLIREGSVRLRLPCFVLGENSLILPSFGTLTGGFEIKPKKDQRIFAVAGPEVFEVPTKGS